MFCIGKGELDSAAAKIGDASVTPINKFQMHHLISLHGIEMLYNFEQLNEIIAEYIVQEFKEFDEELIALHCRVQELTNHVAALQKKIEQISKNAGDGSEIDMSFHHSIHDAIDDQQILIHFKLTAPDQGLKDVSRLRNLLHYSNTKMWDKLTGGGDSRFFAKDLEKHPMIYDYVMTELQDYITYVQ